MDLAEFANRVSNIICGHGGASEEEMISRLEHLAELEQTVQGIQQWDQIFLKVGQMRLIAADVQDGMAGIEIQYDPKDG